MLVSEADTAQSRHLRPPGSFNVTVLSKSLSGPPYWSSDPALSGDMEGRPHGSCVFHDCKLRTVLMVFLVELEPLDSTAGCTQGKCFSRCFFFPPSGNPLSHILSLFFLLFQIYLHFCQHGGLPWCALPSGHLSFCASTGLFLVKSQRLFKHLTVGCTGKLPSAFLVSHHRLGVSGLEVYSPSKLVHYL